LKNGLKENSEAIQVAIANIKAGRPHGLVFGEPFQLTEDIILIKALEYAHKNGGKLPTDSSSKVEGFSGQTWGNFSKALNLKRHGLTREAIIGLTHFFQCYGLKNGRTENPEAIQAAIANIKAGRPHGLVFGEPFQLTEDIILIKALEYADKNGGKLPTQNSGEVEGFPGQTWGIWEQAIRKTRNGLTRKNIAGLNHMFQCYGLKREKTEDPEVINMAIANIKASKPHGLVFGDEFKLSEDFILEAALKYAQNYQKLPTKHSGEIDGFSGLKWDSVQAALRNMSNGLTREGLTGLSHLFKCYGLKSGSKENPEIVQAANNNIIAGRPHGLTFNPDLLVQKRPSVRRRRGPEVLAA
jgi:hypothetical protein